MEKSKNIEAKYKCKGGFTLVELSLSLVFIAILSIAVVLVMSNAISSYHRTITLNKVENIGSGLVRDIRTSIQGASAKSLEVLCGDNYPNGNAANNCKNDKGKKFAMMLRKANVVVNKKTGAKINVPVFGTLCTGTYSYVWNSGYFFSDDYTMQEGVEMASLRYKVGNGEEKVASGFKLLKIRDESRKVCEAAIRYKKVNDSIDNSYGNGFFQSEINMAKFTNTDEEPIEYLSNKLTNVNEETGEPLTSDRDSNLAIYYMDTSISEQIGVTKNAYYFSSFVLGTVQGGINIGASGNFCTTPEGINSEVENLDYCAINKFNFAALAVGG